MLPNDYAARKAIPLYTYLTQYSPNALVEVAKVAVAGNEQHNPGEPMHWAKGKSMDQLNTAMRHMFDHGMGSAYDVDDPWRDSQGQPILHLAKAAWRLLAEIELLCEARDAGIDINTLVRGTHEQPQASQFETMGFAPQAAEVDDTNTRYAELIEAIENADYAKLATAPTVVATAAPKGRLMVCGCYGSCTGHETTARDPVPNPHNAFPLAEDFSIAAPTVVTLVPKGPKDPSGKLYAQHSSEAAQRGEDPTRS